MSASTQTQPTGGPNPEDALPLPDLPVPLPPAPEVVRNKTEVLETWNLVNELYAALRDVKPHETNKRKKMMRAIAPALLLGLKLIGEYATNGILEHAPDAYTSPGMLTNPSARAWLRVWTEAMIRFRRWTKDNSKEKMRAGDLNNNHTIRDLTHRHRSTETFWWVALADTDVRCLKDRVVKSSRVPTGRLPIQFLGNRLSFQGNCDFVLSIVTMLKRYVVLIPESGAAAPQKWDAVVKEIQGYRTAHTTD